MYLIQEAWHREGYIEAGARTSDEPWMEGLVPAPFTDLFKLVNVFLITGIAGAFA